MPTLHFTLQPRLLHALLPRFLGKMLLFLFAGLPVYGGFMLLEKTGVYSVIHWRLLVAIIILAVVMASASIKFEMIRLHRTKYLFYDTHIGLERKIFTTKRQSVPYIQIMKITCDHGLWDRMLKTANIILHTGGHAEDVVLYSIPHAEEVEHRIYKLLKQDKQD